jgi:outer membrane protein TolC
MTIEPIDAPQVPPVAVSAEEAIRNALANRTDVVSARKSLENVAQNVTYYRNQGLPQVNLTFDFNTTAVGGVQFERTGGFPGEIIPGTAVDRGFGSVLGDLLSSAYPNWQLGFVVSYPIGRNASEVNYARTRLQQSQSQLQIKNLELQVATQVRDIARQVNTNAKRVDATRAARVLAERRLEAEQKKFGVGMSTSFLVFQAQRDLATARGNELSALLDFNKSLADFEAVQEAPLSGGGVSVTGASAASGSTNTSGTTSTGTTTGSSTSGR